MSTEPIEDWPLALFNEWLAEAEKLKIKDHNAMALATCDHEGHPQVRMVLLKNVDKGGFRFYTNLTSPKARELTNNTKVSLCFYWRELGKQIRICGQAKPVSPEEADAYFATRPRDSQIGAWASKQSQPLASRHELEKRIAQVVLKYPLGTIPRPDFWSGFCVEPSSIEFWHERPYRLHERIRYTKGGSGWIKTALFP